MRRPFTQAMAGPFARTLTALAGTLLALGALRTLFASGEMFWVAGVAVTLLAVTGVVVRGLLRNTSGRVRLLGVTVAQLLVLTGLVNVWCFPDSAMLGVITTPESMNAAVRTAQNGIFELVNGVAPVMATPNITVLIVTASGLMVIAAMILVVLGGQPLMASLLWLLTGALPPLIAGAKLPAGWVIWVSLLTLVMLWQRNVVRGNRGNPGTHQAIHEISLRGAAVAVTMGLIAVLTASLTAPALTPAGITVVRGGGLRLDASLRLAEDLKRLNDAEAFTLTTHDPTAPPPYVRIATHSNFSGQVWYPDTGPTINLSAGNGGLSTHSVTAFEEIDPIATVWGDTGSGVMPELSTGPTEYEVSVSTMELEERSVSISITRANGSRLPVPSQVSSVDGLGAGWIYHLENGTVTGAEIADKTYTATHTVAKPTIEQLRGSAADPIPTHLELSTFSPRPHELEAVVGPNSNQRFIADTARAVTEGFDTDIDRLLALQAWFRSEFTYTLDSPVVGTHGDSSPEAVAAFLEHRSGYCVHFASAFAFMARTLEMPTRVVVGFLPGTEVGKSDEGVTYSVSMRQMHAWPEVYFTGIGWIEFEPTASLGEAVSFESESLLSDTPAEAAPETPEQSREESAVPEAQQLEEETGGDSAQTHERVEESRSYPGGVIAVLAALATALLAPAVTRIGVRTLRLRRASGGDAVAAWEELTAVLTDHGVRPRPSDTPRMIAESVRTACNARGHEFSSDAALNELVTAVEAASYAPHIRAGSARSETLSKSSDHLREVTREIALAATPQTHARALFTPLSLTIDFRRCTARIMRTLKEARVFRRGNRE